MATLALISGRQLADGDGVPYAGAKAYFYDADGSTAISTYSDSDLTTPNANPIIADADGWFEPIYIGDDVSSYRVIIRSSADTLLRDWSDIPTGVTQEQVGTVLYPRSAAEILAGITPSNYSYEVGNVLRYGAVQLPDETGTTDSATAFNNAWQAIKTTGGRLTVPAGYYYLNSQWLCDADLVYPHNYEIMGYGAQIRSGSAVTGYAMKLYKGFNYHGIKVEGLEFNHRANTATDGAIQVVGASNACLRKIAVECHGNKATYAAYEISPYTAVVSGTNAYWVTLDDCSTRKRTGTDGGAGVYSFAGLRIKGDANAAKIVDCRFSSVTHGIYIQTDGRWTALPNAVLIRDNAFEGLTNAITIYGTGGTLFPTGMKVNGNRVESATTFFNITGSALTDHSFPPILRDNYLSIGSVTKYVVNPNNQRLRIDEPSYYGATAMNNMVGGPNNYRVYCEGAGKNFRISNESDSSSYAGGHLILGGHHLWIDAASAAGRLMIKYGVPTSPTDGTVVGTQT